MWELWLLCIHGWNMKRKGKKRGDSVALHLPRTSRRALSQSVSKKEKLDLEFFYFSAELIVLRLFAGGYLLLLHLLLPLDTICVTNGAKGEIHQHAPPPHLLSSPSSLFPASSSQSRGTETRGEDVTNSESLKPDNLSATVLYYFIACMQNNLMASACVALCLTPHMRSKSAPPLLLLLLLLRLLFPSLQLSGQIFLL